MSLRDIIRTAKEYADSDGIVPPLSSRDVASYLGRSIGGQKREESIWYESKA